MKDNGETLLKIETNEELPVGSCIIRIKEKKSRKTRQRWKESREKKKLETSMVNLLQFVLYCYEPKFYYLG